MIWRRFALVGTLSKASRLRVMRLTPEDTWRDGGPAWGYALVNFEEVEMDDLPIWAMTPDVFDRSTIQRTFDNVSTAVTVTSAAMSAWRQATPAVEESFSLAEVAERERANAVHTAIIYTMSGAT